MKNTLLFTTLVTGLVLTSGCGRTTQTDTAMTDSTTPVTTTTTTPTTSNSETIGSQIDRAASRTSDAVADAGRSTSDALGQAARNTGDAMREMGNDLSAKMTEWRLSAQDLQADIAANRDIVRTKTATAGAPTGNVDKSRLKETVETNLAGRAAGINDLDVELDNETEVVLTGNAQSAAQIGQAMAAALNTPGVTKVTSKIKLNNR